MSAPTSKKFGKSTREVPHHSQKAQKWYPADDEAQPKAVSSNAIQSGSMTCFHDIELATGS